MSDVPADAGLARRSNVPLTYLKWGLLALLQLALISVPLVDRLDVQMSGTVVPLELVPVDPRDLLRGDYVIINLAIGRLPRTMEGAESLKAGQTVFVTLELEGEGAARPVSVSLEHPQSGKLAISGRVRSSTAETVWIDYGIDAFFLPEGEGREIERLDTSRVLLEVAIAGDGRSLPLNLLVDGKVFKSDGSF
ncbi:GDYXXLXY domain-containing protein [Roseibium sp.]|uniref:GDYXXLXY domain-containing protein n=1 Tax=Roseibium sp. TaxID=1936156 RepID=UPI003BACC3E6